MTLALGPRVIVAGPASGVGKTTVAVGLMAALRAAGQRVGAAKVGPDFIDPGYHALATGAPSRSLDLVLSGPAVVRHQAAAAGAGHDLLVIEGVMGLFDGAGDLGVDGSTAEVSRVLDAPVILVVDAAAMSGSVAALVAGFAHFDPSVRVAGVICNRVGGPGHATLLREALKPLGIPVLGVLERDDRLTWRERHLGLVPVIEEPDAVRAALARLAAAVAAGVDLVAVRALAASAPAQRVAPVATPGRVGAARVAVAAGPAFSFVYPENLEALAAAGAELAPFDPLVDEDLPAGCSALYAGGGFPEVFAEHLSANAPLRARVAARVAAGLVVWAECGGYLWLTESLEGQPMTGVLPGRHGVMTPRLHLGYRVATTRAPSPLGPAGRELRGHEFHRTEVHPPGTGLHLASRFADSVAGEVSPRMLASYLHLHLAATPALAESFVRAARAGS
ncbi:MAG: cobyrinate a,c-diamide synthase [Acidimicrobiales bacterium]